MLNETNQSYVQIKPNLVIILLALQPECFLLVFNICINFTGNGEIWQDMPKAQCHIVDWLKILLW